MCAELKCPPLQNTISALWRRCIVLAMPTAYRPVISMGFREHPVISGPHDLTEIYPTAFIACWSLIQGCPSKTTRV